MPPIYTASEFYAIVKNHLGKGGLFCQWLQLYGMNEDGLVSALQTLHESFPQCLIYHQKGAGEIIVVCSKDQEQNLAVQNTDFMTKNEKLMTPIGVDHIKTVQANILYRSEPLKKALKYWTAHYQSQIVTDDNLKLEGNTVPQIESAGAQVKTNLDLFSAQDSSPGETEKFINKGNK